LQLTLRGKSTTQSYRTPIYFVDLTLRDGVTLKDAVQDAVAIDRELGEHGFDQAALEAAAKHGYSNSCFEIDSDDLLDVVEEFYPTETDAANNNRQVESQNATTPYQVGSIERSLRESVSAVD
jgi:hypothetical protein